MHSGPEGRNQAEFGTTGRAGTRDAARNHEEARRQAARLTTAVSSCDLFVSTHSISMCTFCCGVFSGILKMYGCSAAGKRIK